MGKLIAFGWYDGKFSHSDKGAVCGVTVEDAGSKACGETPTRDAPTQKAPLAPAGEGAPLVDAAG